MKMWVLNVIHNCFVHPLLPFLPEDIGNFLHDKSYEWWASSDIDFGDSTPEQIQRAAEEAETIIKVLSKIQ